MLRILVIFAGAIVSLTTLPLYAQDAVLSRLYGEGVHAFFAGDIAKSHEQLTAAINAGSLDPRVYYFRGLDYLKLGREPEATQDFQKGAELECKDRNRSYNVPRSLERVQGSIRLLLDKYRVDARKASYEEANKYRKARFEEIRHEEQRVLRDQPDMASSEAVPAPTPQAEPGAKAAKLDVFGNPQESKNSAKADEEYTEDKPEKSSVTEPADSGDVAEQPTTDAPVAEQPVTEQPTAEKTTAERPTTRKTTILNALMKGTAEGAKKSLGGMGNMLPFGKGKPGGKPPAGMTPPAGGEDLFGSGPEEKKAEKPAAENPQKASPFKPEEPEATEKPASDEKPASGSDEDLFK